MAFEELRQAFGFGPEFDDDSWENRLKEAAYTPPSGIRITFDYEDVSTIVTKKTSAFDFPDADGTLIQDKGFSRRRFPMKIFFSGPDYDKQARVFEAALLERGRGTLEHPVYDKHTVVPFGEIKRSDDLVSAANQAVFQVTFFEALEETYPAAGVDPGTAVLQSLELFGETASAEFASSISNTSVAENQGIIDDFNDNIARCKQSLDKIAAAQQIVRDEFDDAVDTVNNAIDVLVGQPLNLARETVNLIQAPSKAVTGISDRLSAYGNLASDIFTSTDAISEPGGPGNTGPSIGSFSGVGNDSQSPNRFRTRDLFATNYLAGSIRATLYTANASGGASSSTEIKRLQKNADNTNVIGANKFQTSGDALVAADNLFEQFNDLVAWRDENFRSIAGNSADFISAPINTDESGAIDALRNSVALAAGFLIELSFTLKRAKTVVLDRSRNMLELIYELYGDLSDDNINFFMDSNDLAGSEIYELKKGREIVYYV